MKIINLDLSPPQCGTQSYTLGVNTRVNVKCLKTTCDHMCFFTCKMHLFFVFCKGQFCPQALAWKTCLLLKPNLPWVLPANPKHWTIKYMHNYVYCRWCAHGFLNIKELDNIFVRYFGSYSNFTIFIALLKCSDTNECVSSVLVTQTEWNASTSVLERTDVFCSRLVEFYAHHCISRC